MLKSALLRLAHTSPELRTDLLGLIRSKEAGVFDWIRKIRLQKKVKKTQAQEHLWRAVAKWLVAKYSGNDITVEPYYRERTTGLFIRVFHANRAIKDMPDQLVIAWDTETNELFSVSAKGKKKILLPSGGVPTPQALITQIEKLLPERDLTEATTTGKPNMGDDSKFPLLEKALSTALATVNKRLGFQTFQRDTGNRDSPSNYNMPDALGVEVGQQENMSNWEWQNKGALVYFETYTREAQKRLVAEVYLTQNPPWPRQKKPKITYNVSLVWAVWSFESDTAVPLLPGVDPDPANTALEGASYAETLAWAKRLPEMFAKSLDLSGISKTGRVQPKSAATLNGDPDSATIYPNKINHGYDQPLAGGTDVMKRLQDKLLHEQGRPEREKNPKIGSLQRVAQAFLKNRA